MLLDQFFFGSCASGARLQIQNSLTFAPTIVVTITVSDARESHSGIERSYLR